MDKWKDNSFRNMSWDFPLKGDFFEKSKGINEGNYNSIGSDENFMFFSDIWKNNLKQEIQTESFEPRRTGINYKKELEKNIDNSRKKRVVEHTVDLRNLYQNNINGNVSSLDRYNRGKKQRAYKQNNRSLVTAKRGKRHRKIKKIPCLIFLAVIIILIVVCFKLLGVTTTDATAGEQSAQTGVMSVYGQSFWQDKLYVGEDVINGTDKEIVIPRSEYDAYIASIGGEENLPKYTYFRKVARGTLDVNYIKRGSVFSVSTDKKMVALSFDDGPNAKTIDQYLEILNKYNAKATFFMLGQNMENEPEAVKKIVESGNEPATHTWNHKNLKKTSAEIVQMDLEKSQMVFQNLVGYKPYLMRCPYGNIDDSVKSLNSQMGMISAMWDIDTLDWKNKSVDSVVNSVKANTQNGSIILMHEGKKLDLQALPQILQWLTDQGYEVVSVGDLLWNAHENNEDGLAQN
jgi:peptidoglycan/xylan/chitin deacetylase (PgdA/CDA1 family)